MTWVAQPASPAVARPYDLEPPAAPIFVYAAGDIACAPGSTVDSTHCQYAATADLIRADSNFAANSKVFDLGDDQYDHGEFANYGSSYALTWGKTTGTNAFKAQTKPSIGNHQYDDPVGPDGPTDGYQQYWGAQAKWSTNCTDCGYYSFDIGSFWHVVVLNSECDQFPPISPTCSGELTWLHTDLTTSTRQCQIVYGHRPRWAKGGNNGYLDDMWNESVTDGVDLWLSGHVHNYQRYPQMDAAGNAVSSGVREIVVGTGGFNHTVISSSGGPPATPEATDGNSTHFEVLRLSLASTGYSGALLDIGGSTIDSFPSTGTIPCH